MKINEKKKEERHEAHTEAEWKIKINIRLVYCGHGVSCRMLLVRFMSSATCVHAACANLQWKSQWTRQSVELNRRSWCARIRARQTPHGTSTEKIKKKESSETNGNEHWMHAAAPRNILAQQIPKLNGSETTADVWKMHLRDARTHMDISRESLEIWNAPHGRTGGRCKKRQMLKRTNGCRLCRRCQREFLFFIFILFFFCSAPRQMRFA